MNEKSLEILAEINAQTCALETNAERAAFILMDGRTYAMVRQDDRFLLDKINGRTVVVCNDIGGVQVLSSPDRECLRNRPSKGAS